jgi:hypothetical protein
LDQVVVTSLKVAGSSPDKVIDVYNLRNIYSRKMTLGISQPITEIITRRSFWGKAVLARKADNIPAICEPIV